MIFRGFREVNDGYRSRGVYIHIWAALVFINVCLALMVNSRDLETID